jgi:putative proteasome-type protease
VAICPRDLFAPSLRLRLEADSEELRSLTQGWSERFREAFYGLPRFPWEQPFIATDGDSESPPQMLA